MRSVTSVGRSAHGGRALSRSAVLSVVALLIAAILVQLPNTYTGAAAASSARAVPAGRQVLHLKLASAASGVSLAADGSFVGGPTDQTRQLNALLASAKRVKAERLVRGSPRSAVQAKLAGSLNDYFRLIVGSDVDIDALAAQLKTLSIVDTAYAAPTAAPPPATPSFVSFQNYLNPAPDGLDTSFARTFPGGRGDDVTVYDLEYSWNPDHEDLTKARSALIANGTPVDPFEDNSHGTAVLGELVGDDNAFGVTGVVPAAGLQVINVVNVERGFDLVNALYLAGATAAPGDVIILEQQTWGPTPEPFDYVPIEWIPEVYDAIRVLTVSGVNVIEAAGNGNQNLDDTTYYGSPFPAGKPDSGAIIVGAGLNCSGDIRRSRAPFSTYGSRVDLQGPGNCVATTGYGDLYSAGGPNSFYTRFFSGTSSATPVVAAAVAAVSSAYETLNDVAPTPAFVRDVLEQSGTPQDLTVEGALAGHIGPYPNLAHALQGADMTPPSAPANLDATVAGKNKRTISLHWDAATDNVGVTGYVVYRNGSNYQTVNATRFTDNKIRRRTTYTYYIVSIDGAGHASSPSLPVSVQLR